MNVLNILRIDKSNHCYISTLKLSLIMHNREKKLHSLFSNTFYDFRIQYYNIVLNIYNHRRKYTLKYYKTGDLQSDKLY
jgi:hypothetical protein